MITEQKIMFCLIISVKWGENENILCKEMLLFLLTAVRQTTAKNWEDEHWNCWIESHRDVGYNSYKNTMIKDD